MQMACRDCLGAFVLDVVKMRFIYLERCGDGLFRKRHTGTRFAEELF